ncbi:MAG: class I SAM-dependent methyltransferase [Actinomycetes bacterium]
MDRPARGVLAVLRADPRAFAVAKRTKRFLLAHPPTHRMIRHRIAAAYFHDRLHLARRWAGRWTENDNFYYDLTERNRHDLAALYAVVFGVEQHRVAGYIDELHTSQRLRLHIEQSLHADPQLRDVRVGFGRRVGWYAAVRLMKPRVVVETGVHHGVGACILAEALLRNGQEGAPGRYVGTDIDPGAGRLLVGPWATVGTVRIGDSVETLRQLDEPVDLFINDSDHSASYEAQEYDVIAASLSPDSLVLGDNSHVTDELRDFAVRQGRPFVFFREEPADHWYPGGGIGISPSRVPLGPAPDRE